MTKLGEAYVEINAKTQGLEASLKRVQSKLEKHKATFRKVGMAMTAAGAALTGFFAKAVQLAGVQELQEAKLATAIRNVEGATSESYKALIEYAGALQKVTGYADEEIIAAQAMLATFQLTASQIKEITPRLLDMAAATEKAGGQQSDLNAIAIALGKGFTGQAGQLSRYGVVLSEETKRTKDFGAIIKDLDANFKGQAETIGKTWAGQWKIAKAALGDTMEVIGKQLIPALTPIIQKIGSIAESVSNWMEKNEGLAKVLVIVGAALGALMLVLGPLAMAITALVSPVGLVIVAIGGLIAVGVLVVKNWEKIKGFLVKTWDSIAGFAEKVWNGIKRVVIDSILWIVDKISKIPIAGKFAKGWKESLQKVRDEIGKTEKVVSEKSIAMGKALYDSVKNTKLFNKVVELGGKFLKSFGEEADGVKLPVDNLGKSIETTVTLIETELRQGLVATGNQFGLFIGKVIDTNEVLANLQPTLKAVFEEAIPPARDFSDVIDQVPTKFEDMGGEIERVVTEKINPLLDSLGTNLSRSFGDAFEDILKKGSDFVDALNLLVEGLVDSIRGFFGQMVTDFLKNNVFDFMQTAAKEATENVAETTEDLIGGATETSKAAVGAISGMWTGLGAAVGTLIAGLITGGGISKATEEHLRLIHQNTSNINDVLRIDMRDGQFNRMLGHLDESQKHLFAIQARADTRNQLLTKIKEYTEPLSKIKFAASGISETVKSPTLYMAGENGAEDVNIRPHGQSGFQPNLSIESTPVSIYLDSEKVGEGLIKHIANATKKERLFIHPNAVRAT